MCSDHHHIRSRLPFSFRRNNATAMAAASPAMELKLEANKLFKAGEYQASCDVYSKAMGACVSEVMTGSITTTDEQKASIFANRAACSLKLGDHAAVISDCGAAIELKPLYVVGLAFERVVELALVIHCCGLAETTHSLR